ncbi:hypothetical protein CL629_02130 [bacterium]|nr:hypothetical protein [bacterium]
MKELEEFDLVYEEESDNPFSKLGSENSIKVETARSSPKKEFIFSKEGLASLTRNSITRSREKHQKTKSSGVNEQSESFKKTVSTLSDHIVEWCNYSARQGEWAHTYDLSVVDDCFFDPVLRSVRERMCDVIILVRKNKRIITIEWGANESK